MVEVNGRVPRLQSAHCALVAAFHSGPSWKVGSSHVSSMGGSLLHRQWWSETNVLPQRSTSATKGASSAVLAEGWGGGRDTVGGEGHTRHILRAYRTFHRQTHRHRARRQRRHWDLAHAHLSRRHHFNRLHGHVHVYPGAGRVDPHDPFYFPGSGMHARSRILRQRLFPGAVVPGPVFQRRVSSV